ncbi:MAG: MBL fold metallo-hydrolase [Synergistaceae bacterium]|nr:MBL fold metallo-hydrolase [Synergistaceae bacterium]
MIFRTLKTTQISDCIYAVKTAISNFYIYDTGNNLIAFDTGMNQLLSDAGMKKLGLAPERVSHVFLTHSDYDHVGGLKLFKNAAVFISKMEEPMVTGQKARMLIKYNMKIKGYTALDDRQIVNIDDASIQIIEAPGHTIGSACYLINDSILISGDLLRTSKGGRITPFLFFQNMSHSDDKKSLRRLRDEGIIAKSSLILTGHTGMLNNR